MRRVLPLRTTRGKRSEQTSQQIEKDDEIYNKIAEVSNGEVIGLVKDKEGVCKKMQSVQLQAQYKQHLLLNKMLFPYSRGYHYFYNLTQFPRVDGSISYAYDKNNVFNSNYIQDNKIIKNNDNIGKIINRQIFGLPVIQNIIVPKTKDKNICHTYLFHNQDRKYHIDRNLYQYRSILQNFNQLINTNNIYKFTCLKKDIDLILILQNNISIDQKKNILIKKIKILQQKKQNILQFLFNQDKNFYYHSLNQKLHDQIQQLSASLSHQYILSQISYAEYIRQQLKGCHEFKGQQLSRLFRYDQIQKMCITQQSIKNISCRINPQFFNKLIDENIYQIQIPFIYLQLSNPRIMQISQKILSLKLANQNETLYYICKMLWKRIFNHDLLINKQIKYINKYDYDKIMNQNMIQLYKWKKSKQKQKYHHQCQSYQNIDQLINWNVFQTNCKQKNLFAMDNAIQITARQFICLVLFSRLYLCISEIYQFISNNQNFCMLVANDFYSKAHNYVVQCIGTPRIGILQQVLKKLSQWIMKQDIKIDYKLRWVYNPSYRIAYVVKSSLRSDNGIQKQNKKNEQNQDDQDIYDINKKKIKIS